MPHDKFGDKIEVGDEVIVRFVVKDLFGDDSNKTCNVNLESVEGMPEGGHKTQLSAINTKQTEKVIPKTKLVDSDRVYTADEWCDIAKAAFDGTGKHAERLKQ